MIFALIAVAASGGAGAFDMQLKPAQVVAAQKLEAEITQYGMCADPRDLGDLPGRADALINSYHDANGHPAADAIKFSVMMYLGDILQRAGTKEKMCSAVSINRPQAASIVQRDWTALRAILPVKK